MREIAILATCFEPDPELDDGGCLRIRITSLSLTRELEGAARETLLDIIAHSLLALRNAVEIASSTCDFSAKW